MHVLEGNMKVRKILLATVWGITCSAFGILPEGVYNGQGDVCGSRIVLLSDGRALMGDCPTSMTVGRWTECKIESKKCVVIRMVGADRARRQVQAGSIVATIHGTHLSVIAISEEDARAREDAAKALSSDENALGEYVQDPNGLSGCRRQEFVEVLKRTKREIGWMRRPERVGKMMAEIRKDPTWILRIKFEFPSHEEKRMGSDIWSAYSDEMVAVAMAVNEGEAAFSEELLLQFLSKCEDWAKADLIVLTVLKHKSIGEATLVKFAPKVLDLVGKTEDVILGLYYGNPRVPESVIEGLVAHGGYGFELKQFIEERASE